MSAVLKNSSFETGTNSENLFFHDGVQYDSKKDKITFTDDALDELRKLVGKRQETLKEKNKEELPKTHELQKVTRDIVVDGLQAKDKPKKTIHRFIERFNNLMRGNKHTPPEKEVENVLGKVQKYGTTGINIYIQYDDSGEVKTIKYPLIVREEAFLEDMVLRLQQRLIRYGKILN